MCVWGYMGQAGVECRVGCSSVCLCGICEEASSVSVHMLGGLGGRITTCPAPPWPPHHSWMEVGGIAPVTR